MPRRSPCILLAGVLSLTACERPQAPDGAEPAGPGAGQVTQSRVLAEADSGDNWLVNGGRFSGEHFSPQSRISEENIGELGLAWATDIPSPIGLSAEPLVIDGVVYLTGIGSVVYALDASTGVLRWQFDPQVRLDMGFGNSLRSRWNRGAAVWEGRVQLAKDRGDIRKFGEEDALANYLGDQCIEQGLLLRAMGDTAGFCPPMIITEDQTDEMFTKFQTALDRTLEWSMKRSA